jgi:hypothetical protein
VQRAAETTSRLSFDWIKNPVLRGIGGSLAQDLRADMTHTLRVVLLMQNGALLGSLGVGVYAPALGDALFVLVYAAIFVYGAHSVFGQKRFIGYLLECRSFRQAMGKEILACVYERIGLLGIALGRLLFDLPQLAAEIGDYLWHDTKRMIMLVPITLLLNLVMVRLVLIPTRRHWLLR